MDARLRNLIREYLRDSADVEARKALEEGLKRVGAPDIATVAHLQTVAQEGNHSLARGHVSTYLVGGEEEFQQLVNYYSNLQLGMPLLDSYDPLRLGEWLLSEISVPPLYADTTMNEHKQWMQRGAYVLHKTNAVFDAIEALSVSCEGCGMFIAGCRCDFLMPDPVCSQCGNYAPECNCVADEPYPVQVGNAYGGPVCIMVHEDPTRCGCRGSGWAWTDFDSSHQCPQHYTGQIHPEDAGYEEQYSDEEVAEILAEQPPTYEEIMAEEPEQYDWRADQEEEDDVPF